MTITQSDLEGRLWKAANALRGPVDPADFKTYVFPMLFWKWISDTWVYEHDEALENVRARYASGEPPALDGVSIRLEPGRKVALVRAHGPIEDVLQLTHVEEISATVEDPAAVGFPDEADQA